MKVKASASTVQFRRRLKFQLRIRWSQTNQTPQTRYNSEKPSYSAESIWRIRLKRQSENQLRL